jgi:enoyl-CoA hydratase/carnithine racemase
MGLLDVNQDGVCVVLRINRPDKRNALNSELFDELTTAITEAGQDRSVRGVVLTGADEHFSTGVDLGEATTVLAPDEFTQAWNEWHGLTHAIENLELPVVAAISGYCLTGGLEVALACDFRFGATNVQMGITSSKIGSVAGIGGTQRLPRLVGPSWAKRMLFTGEFIDAETALRIGLIDEICEVGEVVDAAVRLVHLIGTRAPLSVGWHKKAVNVGLRMDLAASLEFERALCARAFTTEDRMEGMRAFLESREPDFRRK